jgi:hypothetical protein
MHLRLDAEQFRDEIVQMRRQRDQQLGFLLVRQHGGLPARRAQLLAQRIVSARERGQERCVNPHQTVARVEVGERQPVR